MQKPLITQLKLMHGMVYEFYLKAVKKKTKNKTAYSHSLGNLQLSISVP